MTPFPCCGDHGHGLLQESAGIPEGIAEDISRHILGVRPNEHGFIRVDLALDQHKMLGLIHVAGIDVGREFSSVPGWKAGLSNMMDQGIMLKTIVDEVGDRGDFHSVLNGKFFQVGQTGHRPVLSHNLTNDPGRVEAGQAGEVNRAFRLSGADQYAPLTGAQREHMAGHDKIFRMSVLAGGRQNSGGSVLRRNPRVTPLRASKDMVNAVPRGAVFFATIIGSPRASMRSSAMGIQINPRRVLP